MEKCEHGVRPIWCMICTPPVAEEVQENKPSDAPAEQKKIRPLRPEVPDGKCARGCGRDADRGKRRPEGELALFCRHCRDHAKLKLRRRGASDKDEASVLAELRRPPLRGPMPGFGWRATTGEDLP